MPRGNIERAPRVFYLRARGPRPTACVPGPGVAMAEAHASSESFWVATAPDAAFAALSGDVSVDVAIVGGGMVGLTAAALLKREGRRVAVIEARRVGRQATGRSTAKLTSQHATIYAQLLRTHGRDGARSYAEANQAAIECVAGLVNDLGIDCDFERRSAYVFTRSDDKLKLLESETEAARGLGLPAELLRDVSLPFPVRCAMRFTGQAQLHPCKYLVGLARFVDGDGSHVFESTRAQDAESGAPMRVRMEHGTVTARDVIVATHLPVTGHGMYFAKAYPHSQPILAAPIDPAVAPDGMFISVDTPTLSVLRTHHEGRTYLIAAGGHTKPGHADELLQSLADLERSVRADFDVGQVSHRWTNHDYLPMDRVPFVGRPSSGDPHLFVATGFHGWGLSNGTAAAMILAEAIAGRPSPWAALFDAGRVKPVASAPAFVAENVQVAKHLVAGYLARRPRSAAELGPGEAAVIDSDGGKIAAYRDQAGTVHQVSAVCTHMKCVVGWNPIARSWDCPCHGSRFEPDGAVIAGPAVSPLPKRG